MLGKEEIDQLKEIFVTRAECDNQMADVSDKLSKDNARLAVIEAKLDDVRKLEWTIIAGVIGLIITAIGGLIFR